MTPWLRTADAVADVLDAPPEARAEVLRSACLQTDGTLDRALQAEVEALVEAALAADEAGALVSPGRILAGDAPPVDDLALGSRVGPWRLESVLGEGGMGIVYRAERADGAFRRAVALKRLRSGPGRRALAARLRAERETLARLDHPGIARLLDGGVSEDGTPYLVTELVAGAPITRWAEASGATVRERVEVFAAACDAAAYAHARLVVHRDLKPSNLFVVGASGEARPGFPVPGPGSGHDRHPSGGDPIVETGGSPNARGAQNPVGRVPGTRDAEPGTPQPKLLDFGIAKILGDETSGAAPLTRTGATVLTPAYAAPEQVAGGEVTTATDLYALGVILYELLARQRPYSVAGLSPAEAERTIHEAVPPPPSAVAPHSVRGLGRDLDTIALKALAKEPARRYESAAALAADLRRWLEGLPVEARPASVGYRVGRFVRRHRAGVIAAASGVAILAAVIGVAFARVSAERDRAETEAANAVAAQDFVYGMLAAPRSDEQGRDVRVADLLDGASAILDSTFSGQPAVLVEARSRLANTYQRLGLYEESARENRWCVEAASRAFGPESDDALTCRVNLGSAYRRLSDFPRADALITGAIAVLQRRYGDDSPQLADAYNALSALRNDQNEPEAALDISERLLAIDRRRAQTDPSALPDVANSLNDVAVSLFGLGRFDEAIARSEESVRIHESLGDTISLSFAGDLKNLGAIYGRAGRIQESERALRRAIRIGTQAGGPDHPRVAGIYATLGQLLTREGDPSEAESLIRESLRIREASLGPDHVEMAYSWEFLALALHAQRRPEMREAAREARRLYALHFGEDHPWVADVDTLLTGS